MRAVGGDMAHGDDGHGLVTLHGEETLDRIDVVVAYPTGAKATLGCRQTQVFDGDAQVDVAMRLAVIRPHPTMVYILHTEHIHRRRLEPVAVVALPCLLLGLVRGEEQEAPRLSVACGGSQTHAFHDISDVSLADRLVGVFSAREPLLC